MTEHTYFEANAPFEAARQLVGLSASHRSGRLHGHSFVAGARARLPTLWANQRGADTEQLRAYLALCVQELDGRSLNDHLAQPTDVHVAQWICDQLHVPGVTHVSVQSTPDRGVELEVGGKVQAWRRFDIQCAHLLPHVDAKHRCARLHDHGFKVTLQAELQAEGYATSLEYELLDEVCGSMHAGLDHRHINIIPGLENPTMERMAAWVWERAKVNMPSLNLVTVCEGERGASFDGARYGAWMSMAIESESILRYSSDDECRPKVGKHSYVLRVYLNSPFNEDVGAVLDSAQSEELVSALHRRLEKQPLREFPGQDGVTIDHFLGWLAFETLAEWPSACRFDLYERPGYGVVLGTAPLGPLLPV